MPPVMRSRDASMTPSQRQMAGYPDLSWPQARPSGSRSTSAKVMHQTSLSPLNRKLPTSIPPLRRNKATSSLEKKQKRSFGREYLVHDPLVKTSTPLLGASTGPRPWIGSTKIVGLVGLETLRKSRPFERVTMKFFSADVVLRSVNYVAPLQVMISCTEPRPSEKKY